MIFRGKNNHFLRFSLLLVMLLFTVTACNSDPNGNGSSGTTSRSMYDDHDCGGDSGGDCRIAHAFPLKVENPAMGVLVKGAMTAEPALEASDQENRVDRKGFILSLMGGLIMGLLWIRHSAAYPKGSYILMKGSGLSQA